MWQRHSVPLVRADGLLPEEALFNPRPDRGRTLLAKWRMPLDELLPFAVAHELGHALCREVDERRAND